MSKTPTETVSRKVLIQVDGNSASTRHCPCGSSITWSNSVYKLNLWTKEHASHVDQPPMLFFQGALIPIKT